MNDSMFYIDILLAPIGLAILVLAVLWILPYILLLYGSGLNYFITFTAHLFIRYLRWLGNNTENIAKVEKHLDELHAAQAELKHTVRDTDPFL
jgi:hypothetical protein